MKLARLPTCHKTLHKDLLHPEMQRLEKEYGTKLAANSARNAKMGDQSLVVGFRFSDNHAPFYLLDELNLHFFRMG